MNTDPSKWIDTLPGKKDENSEKVFELNANKWINTLPKAKPKSPFKKYFLSLIIFIIGFGTVSIIKNETRILQKEINNLKTSINEIEFDLHQAILDHEVITSPQNISKLAKEYLESNFSHYKKSQINELKESELNLASLDQNNTNNLLQKNEGKKIKIRIEVAKKVEQEKIKLQKLHELYSNPEELPDEMKYQISLRIEETKNDLKQLYDNPKGFMDKERIQRRGIVQVVKAFFGLPVIQGR